MAHLLASPTHIPKGETMKKIAILTSVLALAACGGGGGGGGGAQLPPLPPTLIEQGNSTTTVARNANSETLADDFGKNFISSLKGDATTLGNATLKFADNGKLTNIKIVSELGTSSPTIREYDVAEDGQVPYISEYSFTISPTTRVFPRATDSGHVATFGNVVGLQYSDFGYLTHGQAKHSLAGIIEADNLTFAGGYQTMKRDLPSEGDFKGVAIAVIKNSQGDMMETATRDANVHVDTAGKTTLTANFTHAANPWHDVKLSNDDLQIYDNGANIPEQFRVKTSETSSTPTHDKKYLMTQAFGEGVAPTEMVATGAAMGMAGATDGNKINAQFSFGGKFEQ